MEGRGRKGRRLRDMVSAVGQGDTGEGGEGREGAPSEDMVSAVGQGTLRMEGRGRKGRRLRDTTSQRHLGTHRIRRNRSRMAGRDEWSVV